MKFVDFKNSLNNGEVFSAYLFEGEDAYFRSRGLSLLKNKFLSQIELNFASFEGTSDLSGIESSLFSFPFLDEKRITCIKEFYPDAKLVKGFLSEYLSQPVSNSILIILNEKPSEALKKFDSIAVVDCNKQDPSILIRWIKAEMSNQNISIDGETASRLVEYCQQDMTRIENETAKLIALVGENGNVSKEILDENVYKSAEYKIYEMTEHIGKRKYDKAFSVISDMIQKNETPQKILISVYNYFRRLLHVAISNKTNREIASLLGVKEFAVVKAKEQAKYFKPRSLKKAVDLLSDTDYKIKSGLATAEDAMWFSVFKIMCE